MVIYGLIDHNKHPECYKINRTWSNIENKYIDGDFLSSLTRNTTEEIIPECYILRARILGASKNILGLIILYMGISLIWSYMPDKQKKEIIKRFNSTWKK